MGMHSNVWRLGAAGILSVFLSAFGDSDNNNAKPKSGSNQRYVPMVEVVPGFQMHSIPINGRKFSVVEGEIGIIRETDNGYADITYDFVNKLTVVKPVDGSASSAVAFDYRGGYVPNLPTMLELYDFLTHKIGTESYSDGQDPNWDKIPSWFYATRNSLGQYVQSHRPIGGKTIDLSLEAIKPPAPLIPPTLIP
jgi:hypothetical protein